MAYEITVEDPVMQRTFCNPLEVKVLSAQPKTPPKVGRKAKRRGKSPGPYAGGEGGIAFPQVNWLNKSSLTWPDHFDHDDDCLDIVMDSDEAQGEQSLVYSFTLNADNKALQAELKAASGSAAVLRKKFEVAMVLIGLALIQDARTREKAISDSEGGDGKDGEEELRVRAGKLTRAIAPVLLPMIEALGDLGSESLEQSDLVGQAV